MRYAAMREQLDTLERESMSWAKLANSRQTWALVLGAAFGAGAVSLAWVAALVLLVG